MDIPFGQSFPSDKSPGQPAAPSWQPPSDHLLWRHDWWEAPGISPVSYPEAGNELCYQVEDGSYWFRHRMDCIHALLGQFPPSGTLVDIGGGNGFVAFGLQAAGLDVVLVEPGPGARNALRRGVRHVIHASLEDARFHPHSLPAAGAFDVVEHIADDAAFLRGIREMLVPGGRFYCTVPAYPALWSDEDAQAGHFRRYNRQTLSSVLRQAGFTVEFLSPIFLWLTLPVGLCRTLPSKLGLRQRSAVGTAAAMQSDHRLPGPLAGLAGRAHAWELRRLQARHPLPGGTSLLCVARTKDSRVPAA